MQASREFLEDELPRWKAERDKIAELSAVESGPEMLPSSEDVLGKYQRLLRLRADKKAKNIEIDQIEAEEERLEMAIKQRHRRSRHLGDRRVPPCFQRRGAQSGEP
jgi:hypothetical protein